MQLFLISFDGCEEPFWLLKLSLFVITSPHSAVVTQQFLEQLKWDISDHPPYIPDLTRSDFHLFPEFKNWLGDQSFLKNWL
ncbi:hypothetical protein AVEN_268234-1 [Araneus ventricosus]|uniref:Tc1-like transposase DDE domain-containing protein n=1 Tax=Araneus ventricosus TaxID=182803 RepID=A0A4Y2BJJ9_ARAVE|nr:hypothetical protein AVEN_268234-1 [Araneus ventricosus]